MRPTTAKISFNEHGTPVAEHFDDVYFSNDDGIAETRYVFITGNALWERWQNHQFPHYVIAETGFGTGLNFFVTVALFQQFKQRYPQHTLQRLYFLTTEKYPLSKDDLTQALAQYSDFAETKQQLLEQYPVLLEGCHRLNLANCGVVLDLWIGDIEQSLPAWHCPQHGLVDSWFLDGFAPSKNPQMWNERLFAQMARLSKRGASFATFTAAGIVKRGLLAAGFAVQKIKGFGRKREMLVGNYQATHNDNRAIYAPFFRYLAPPLHRGSRVAIVGGGIAAATVANALVNRGIHCTIYCADDRLAQGASGNAQGGVYPQLHVQASLPAQLQATTFLYARRFYNLITQQGGEFAHDWCGVLLPAFKPAVAERQTKLLDQGIWPTELVHGVNTTEANRISGIELDHAGLFMPLGGWLNPPELVQTLCSEAAINVVHNHAFVKADNATSTSSDSPIKLTFHVNQQKQHQSTSHEQKSEVQAEVDHVIFAQGHFADTNSLLASLPFQAVRGQVEAVPSARPLSDLQTVICHKGYLTPEYQGRHALGSTYVKNDTNTDVRPQETAINLTTHRNALPDCKSLTTDHHDGVARASIRMTLPDHQPAVGLIHDWSTVSQEYQRKLSKDATDSRLPLPPPSRCSVIGALGSRGLTTAPLLAETLASQLCAEPLPLPNHLLDALSPARFMVKAYKQKKGV